VISVITSQKKKGNLKKHVDSVHGNVRYPCDQCDYKATQKGSLKMHIGSVHGDVIYPCDQWNAKWKANLNRT